MLRVEGVVDGSLEYETLVGGDNSVPDVRALSIETVGYADVSGDVSLGQPAFVEYGGANVDVTVTNAGDTDYRYSVDIVAESPDGVAQYEMTYATVDKLAPGQSASVEATFFDDLPTDATLRFASVGGTPTEVSASACGTAVLPHRQAVLPRAGECQPPPLVLGPAPSDRSRGAKGQGASDHN